MQARGEGQKNSVPQKNWVQVCFASPKTYNGGTELLGDNNCKDRASGGSTPVSTGFPAGVSWETEIVQRKPTYTWIPSPTLHYTQDTPIDVICRAGERMRGGRSH